MVPLHLCDAGSHDIAGESSAHEDDESVQARDAVAAVGERLDPEVELLVLANRRGHPTSIGFRCGDPPGDARHATALKREQISRVRETGIEHIYTKNETNAGMRGVNARLGYRPAPTRILVSGPLAT